MISKEFADAKRSTQLKFYDGGNRQSISGIRATIFGATGFLGAYVRENNTIIPRKLAERKREMLLESRVKRISRESKLIF